MKKYKLLITLLKPYWKQILVAMGSLILVVAASLFSPMLMQRVIDEGISAGNRQAVLTNVLLMLGLAVIGMLAMVVNAWFGVNVSQRYAADVRTMLYEKIQTFSFGNLDDFESSELLVRLTSDVNMIQQAVRMVLRILWQAPLMLVGSLLLMLVTSPQMSLLLLVLIPLTVAIIVWITRRSEPLYRQAQEKLERLNGVLQENLAGARVVKAFVRADHETDRFGVANQDLTRTNIAVNQLMALLFPVMQLLLNAGMIAVLWFGGQMAFAGALSTGEVVAFVNYLLFTLMPIALLGMILPNLAASKASADRIIEVLETEPDVRDKTTARAVDSQRGGIVFENVWFSYNGNPREDAVLKGISFTAEPGETVAILGQTGSGKSSLVHLVPRFYDPIEGTIRLDGTDLRDLTQDSLRAEIGVCLQEAVLFSGTVRDNIRYGCPDATDEDVIAAARAAQAHTFISELPQGYDTQLGQRGAGLSGGQKQRVAIARALLTQPSVLILDDSTSAVDVQTETRIQTALSELMRQTTNFVVAQRISTVLTADKIIVLDKGEIVAAGTHSELLQSSPIYQDIYASQLGGKTYE